ncbi:hypothetical protein BG74_07225 [Sodalis-like endosymbiont of Proechinophthirus fluctus]|nr:hypothetical protein BG74_07225 [Sodalis-like endosymbiont of Proechinophthirus fluctus]
MARKACRVGVLLFLLVISFFFIITLKPLAGVYVNSPIGLWCRPIYVSHFSKVVQQKAMFIITPSENFLLKCAPIMPCWQADSPSIAAGGFYLNKGSAGV